jgi:hypothetical protein
LPTAFSFLRTPSLPVLPFAGIESLRARQRRVNAFAIGELAALGKDFHAFVIERHPQSSLASLIDSHEAHLL